MADWESAPTANPGAAGKAADGWESAPTGGKSILSRATERVREVPGDIAEEFKGGQEQISEAYAGSMEALKKGEMPPDGTALKYLSGGLREAGAPFSGAAKALVGDPARALIPQDNIPGRIAANTLEDVAGMAGPNVFFKAMSKPASAIYTLFKRAPNVFEDKATQKILKRFDEDVQGGGITAQSALDLVDEARKSGKALTLADVGGENVKGLAGNVSRARGPARNSTRQFVNDRDAGASDRLTEDVNKYVSTGSAYYTTQALLEARSAGAAPLYEKAFSGGSIAPLERQFEESFAESAKAVDKASKEVNAALTRITQAKGKLTTSPGVYGAASGNQDLKEAQRAFDEAEKKLNAAQESKASVLDTLKKAQEDKSANAPGAVWNPRIQQFLNDPIVKGGLSRGLEIQRLEALAEGKPFNPTEYAITGTGKDGEPIVGKVPNMRLLNSVKKGLDAIIQDNQDGVTGRLNEKGRAVDMVRRAFTGELDTINPDYKVARDYWSDKSKSLESVRWGRNILTRSPEENAAEMKAMSQGDKEFAKMGAADLIREKILKTGIGADETKSIIQSPWVRGQLRPLFTSDKEFDQFMNSVASERVMFDTKKRITGGSQEAEKAAEDKSGDLIIDGAHTAAKAVTGNVLGAVKTLWKMKRDLGLRNNPALNEAIAKILFDPQIDIGGLDVIPDVAAPPDITPARAAASSAGASNTAQSQKDTPQQSPLLRPPALSSGGGALVPAQQQ